jgi:hypothetical protein
MLSSFLINSKKSVFNWALHLLGSEVKHVSFLLAMTFLIVALAGPKIGTEVREVKQRGVDMLIALGRIGQYERRRCASLAGSKRLNLKLIALSNASMATG